MRWTIAGAALIAASAAGARDLAVESAIYTETAGADGARVVVPAARLVRGDRVVTILSWNAPRDGRFTAVSRIPSGLALESASKPGLEISTDGGRSWRRIADPDTIPRGATHLRWQIGGGEGQFSYRAVVR